jgi:PAS domain S-box-containing protein
MPSAHPEEITALRDRVAQLERQLAEARQSASAQVTTPSGETLGLQELRAVFENYSGGMSFSREGIIIDANMGLARMLRTTVDKLIGRPIVELIATQDRELVQKHVDRGYTHAYELSVLRADGTTLPVEATASTIRGDGFPLRFTVIRDISKTKQAEESLRAEQDFLRMLIKAHERDRQLMAYEIHDGLVQYITAAVWHLESVMQKLQLDAESRDMLTKVQDLLRQSMADARRVLSGLRPPILDEQGIVVALDYLAAENTEPDTLEVEVERQVQFRRLEPLLEGTIFRIVQESLNNVRKHSRAAHALVRLVQRGNRILLVIQDDGRGFRTDAVLPDRFGLQGIRKRAELLGGTARIESMPGKGTTVTVDLPLMPYLENDFPQ